MKSLSEIRNDKKITQQKLGRILGVTSQAVANYECGKRTPNIVFARKYAKALGISLDELAESFEIFCKKTKKFNSYN